MAPIVRSSWVQGRSSQWTALVEDQKLSMVSEVKLEPSLVSGHEGPHKLFSVDSSGSRRRSNVGVGVSADAPSVNSLPKAEAIRELVNTLPKAQGNSVSYLIILRFRRVA